MALRSIRLTAAKKDGLGNKGLIFTLKPLLALRQRRLKRYSEQGAQGALISLKDRLMVQTALVPLQEYNSKHGGTFSVENAVQFFIRAMHAQKEKQQAPFVDRAVEQFLEVKSDPNGGKGNKQLSKKTLQELNSVGGIIVDTWKYKRVNEVTGEMIKNYLNKTKTAKGKHFTNQTKLNRLTKIKQFFNYCMEKPREWVKENPCDGITITAESKEVEILANSQVLALLEAAMKEKESVRAMMIPYLALGLFAGLRPEEAQKMRWERIEQLDEEKRIAQVKVPAEISKIGETRYADLSETGWDLIKPFLKQSGPIGWSRRAFRRIRDKAGFAGSTWPADCIRHTYASNWLAVHKERSHLAEIMGNSSAIIRRHYKRAIPIKEAEIYFKISIGNQMSVNPHNETHPMEKNV